MSAVNPVTDSDCSVPELAEASTYRLSADDNLQSVTSFITSKPKTPFHDDVINDVTDDRPSLSGNGAGSDAVDLIRNAVGTWDQNMQVLS
jgi:hypothetical protein